MAESLHVNGCGLCETTDRFQFRAAPLSNHHPIAPSLRSPARLADHLTKRAPVHELCAPTSRALQRSESAPGSCKPTSDAASILSLRRVLPTETACWAWERTRSAME